MFRFEVSLQKGLVADPQSGRLFIILSRTNDPEPRTTLDKTGPDAPVALALDLSKFDSDTIAALDESAFTFPVMTLTNLPRGDYFAQALFDNNRDLRSPLAPGNLFSETRQIHFDPARGDTLKFELDHQIPPEELPPDTDQLKFIKFQSKLLTKFHGRPMFLRAGIVLPRDYQREPARRFPLWVRIGGYGTRYSTTTRMMAENSGFRKTWVADGTPQFILLQLDGAGPYGDPYYVNSANNGPFGDALIKELIPYVEEQFRIIVEPRARVLSGTSTGGWVSLALQIFYPDFFNGVWSSCPDPVDFRALQLINIYQDKNAYVDSHGREWPSERDAQGKMKLTMCREVGMENLLGSGNSFTLSGEQWGSWNAVYSPRGRDGLPEPLWDPPSGKINPAVVESWKKYDLHLVLQQNWKTLGPKLRGKIHIGAGEMDNYYLNNAVHLLDRFLSQVNPPFEGRIVYGPGKRHGWFYLSTREMLDEMSKAVTESSP